MKIFLAIFCFLGSVVLWGQKSVWSLSDLILYAKENNIKIKQNRINEKISELDINTAKNSVLPNLYVQSNQHITNNPYSVSNRIINTGNGSYIESFNKNRTSFSSNFQINSSLPLFKGGKHRLELKKAELIHKNTALQSLFQENQITARIIELYIQVLHISDLILVHQNLLEIAQNQQQRAEIMFENGSLSQGELYQFKAQTSSDQYNFIQAKSSLSNLLIQLKHTMNFLSDEPLELQKMDTLLISQPLENKDEIFRIALENRPEIASAKVNKEISELNSKIVYSNFLPSIELFTSVGSFYQKSDISFGNQLKNNWSNSAGLNIQIPIFNRKYTKNLYLKSKEEIQNSELNSEQIHSELWYLIERTWMETHTAEQKYLSAQQKVKSFQKSFSLMNEKYKLGAKNISELLLEKNHLFVAQQQLIELKYTIIFNKLLLNFYTNGK